MLLINAMAASSGSHLSGDIQQAITGVVTDPGIVQLLKSGDVSPETAVAIQNAIDIGAVVLGIAEGGRQIYRVVKPGLLSSAERQMVEELPALRSGQAPGVNTLEDLKSPGTRHYADKVSQSSVAKEINTVIDRSVVDVNADVIAIRSGDAMRVGDTYIVNGRTYGSHDGTLFPISGPGLYTLDRGAYKALGVLNKFGDSALADTILKNMGVSDATKASALNVWKAITK